MATALRVPASGRSILDDDDDGDGDGDDDAQIRRVEGKESAIEIFARMDNWSESSKIKNIRILETSWQQVVVDATLLFSSVEISKLI